MPNMTDHLSQRKLAQVLLQEGVEAVNDSTAAIALFRQSAAVDPSWAMPPFLLGSYFAANAVQARYLFIHLFFYFLEIISVTTS